MIFTTIDGRTAVDLTLFDGRSVTVFLDKVTYIAQLDERFPCKTKLHFEGDPGNSIEVRETFNEIMSAFFTPPVEELYDNAIEAMKEYTRTSMNTITPKKI